MMFMACSILVQEHANGQDHCGGGVAVAIEQTWYGDGHDMSSEGLFLVF